MFQPDTHDMYVVDVHVCDTHAMYTCMPTLTLYRSKSLWVTCLCLCCTGHDESRASQAAAPLTHQIEAMLADTTTGQLPHGQTS